MSNKINGEIKNVATIGEEEPEETIDTINITGEKTNTETDNIVKEYDGMTLDTGYTDICFINNKQDNCSYSNYGNSNS